MKSQAARSAERRKMDVEDAKAAAERADNNCEVCGAYAPYVPGSMYSGSNHHVGRKKDIETRRDRSLQAWSCWMCHGAVHSSDSREMKEKYQKLIERREES